MRPVPEQLQESVRAGSALLREVRSGDVCLELTNLGRHAETGCVLHVGVELRERERCEQPTAKTLK